MQDKIFEAFQMLSLVKERLKENYFYKEWTIYFGHDINFISAQGRLNFSENIAFKVKFSSKIDKKLHVTFWLTHLPLCHLVTLS